jgi:RNA polymerase sigma-70 factor (ECF subfamily)
MTALQKRRSLAGMQNSSQAQAELFGRHQGELRQFLLGLLRNGAEADDVLQEVFLRLVETWGSIELGTVRGWLFTVAYHQALALRRRRNLHDSALEKLRTRPTWEGDPPSTADEQAMRREVAGAVRLAVQSLPPAQREVIERRMYKNQRFATIAAELGCPLGTVLTRMRLAVKKLSELLGE